MYGVVKGPNLDKDSSQIVVCPKREAAVCSCVSVSLVNAFVVIATSGGMTRQPRLSVQRWGCWSGNGWFSACSTLVSVLIIYGNNCHPVNV